MSFLKNPGKALGRSEKLRNLACALLARYITFLYRTGRWRVENDDLARRYWDEGKPFILCFWHGRLMMMPYSWRRDRQIHMLISAHRDGQLIGKTVSWFGIKTAEGSSTRGGAKALRAMVRALKSGEWVGITPDGPAGPRMQVSGGVIDIARMAQVPILPATFGIEKGRLLGSWDRFLLGYPFSRGLFVWGDPLTVPRDADGPTIEACRKALEDSLNAITEYADRETGREPVKQAIGEEAQRQIEKQQRKAEKAARKAAESAAKG